MEAVYRQARAVLDKAAAATNKDQKTAQISLLVELCAYRGDSALVAEVVEGVAGYAADRSAKVRKAVVEFVDAVVARGKLQVTDECASTALATCCVLAVDENEPVAAAALRGAARLLGDERFAAATVDDASRERLRNAVDPSHRRTATGRDDAVQSDAHRDAALAAVVALLVRDAAADGKRPSKATKADAAALAARAETGDAAALDAAAAALGRQFAKCHRELVAAILAALEKDSSHSRAACRALHAAELERTRSSTGAAPRGRRPGAAGGASRVPGTRRDAPAPAQARSPRPPTSWKRRFDAKSSAGPPTTRCGARGRASPSRARSPRRRSGGGTRGRAGSASSASTTTTWATTPWRSRRRTSRCRRPRSPPRTTARCPRRRRGGSWRARGAPGRRRPPSPTRTGPGCARARRRGLAAPAETVAGEKRFETRDAIVARLARGEACDQPEGVARVLRRAVADKKSRRDGLELGLRVLFELYAREKRGAARDAYDRCLLALLGRSGTGWTRRSASSSRRRPWAPPGSRTRRSRSSGTCASRRTTWRSAGRAAGRGHAAPGAAGDRCLRRALELTRRPDVAPEVRGRPSAWRRTSCGPTRRCGAVVASRARGSRRPRAGARGPRRRRRRRAGGGAPGLALVVALCVRTRRSCRTSCGPRRRPPTRPTRGRHTRRLRGGAPQTGAGPRRVTA